MSGSQGELRSVYSTNLLLLMTQKDTGLKTVTLEDFRASMEVPATYRYADIKRYAIVPAVKELNEKADLLITWGETKRGRAVYSLQFKFKFMTHDSLDDQALEQARPTEATQEVFPELSA